jgi:hypothetical protein
MRHPIVAQAYANEYRKDVMREVERRRMARQAGAGSPGMVARLIARMSRLLAALTARLQTPRTSRRATPLKGLKNRAGS